MIQSDFMVKLASRFGSQWIPRYFLGLDLRSYRILDGSPDPKWPVWPAKTVDYCDFFATFDDFFYRYECCHHSLVLPDRISLAFPDTYLPTQSVIISFGTTNIS